MIALGEVTDLHDDAHDGGAEVVVAQLAVGHVESALEVWKGPVSCDALVCTSVIDLHA